MDSMGVNYRRQANQSVLDKKKKKKRKKRTREGKRSSASSASASGSPDSTGPRRPKAQASQSCPNLSEKNAPGEHSAEFQDELKINECLRWPAHSLYIENSFRTDLVQRFPVSGITEDEENERIAIYKMNRRKRYLAAQQALIKKYPDIGVYASSSGNSSGHDTNEDKTRINNNSNNTPSCDTKLLCRPPSQNVSSDVPLPVVTRENFENLNDKLFSNGDVAPNTKAGDSLHIMTDNRKKFFSGV